MANSSGVVGVLRALLTADTAQFDTSMRKAATTTEQTTKTIGGLGREIGKLTPQAERMVKAFGGERQLNAANNLASAISRIGGATKLTTTEQARANVQLNAAIEKYKVLGMQAPKAVLDAEKATSSLSGKVSGLLGGLGPLGPAIATAFSATAIIGFARAVTESADTLTKLRDRTGVSLQGLQRLQRAGDDAGNSIEDITAAIASMQRRMADAKPGDAFNKALERLGLNAQELRAQDPAGQFMAIGDALKAIQDPAEKISLSNALGGRQFIAVLPTLTRGFDDLRGHIVGMSDDTVVALDDAGDAVKKLSRQVLDAGASILAGSIDFMFPFKAAVRDVQSLNAELESMRKQREGGISGLLGPAALPTLSMEDADRISKELDDKVKALIADEQKLADVMARAFGLDKIANLREMVQAIGGIQGVVHMDAESIKALNKLTDDAIGAAQRNGREVPLEWFRILEATRDNLGSLQEYLKTVQQLPEAMREIPQPPELIPFKSELDQERMRKLLEANAPGSGIFKAATVAGETIGHQMTVGIGRAFEQVPHFLTSSIIHSGSFINGLKAIGVDMADAIVEPLIKRFVAQIAGARLASALAGGAALGGKVATAGTVAAGAGAAAATTAAGGTAVVTTTTAGGLGSSLAAFATNPWTIGIAAGIGAILAFRHFHQSTNDKKDKFLAQFAGFDTSGDKADTANPPGFHGLDRYLTKYKHHDWFTALVAAKDGSSLKNVEGMIAGFASMQGRAIKSFEMGGFVPPGVVQPAILHGGAYGETITPNSAGRSMSGTYINHWHISATDGPSVQRLVRSPEFISEVRSIIKLNHRGIGSTIRRVTTGID